MTLEILRFALRGLSANKLRSGLTTLGILIGVGAVIMLVAVGNGSSRQVRQNIERLGTNTLTVLPSTTGRAGGRGGGGGLARLLGAGGQQANRQTGPRAQARDLSVDDARALADPGQAPSVKSVSPVAIATQSNAAYQGGSHQIQQFVGAYPAYFEAFDDQVERGTYFTSDDVLAGRKVVVLGRTVADDLFGDVDPIGRRITVAGVNFTVDGVLKTKGSTGFQDADDVAIAPLPAVQQSLTGYGALSQIVVQARAPEAVDTAQAEVTGVLNQRHGVTNTPDFQVLNQASLQTAIGESSRTFTVLLGAVAAISLLVGGIGITNIMLVTVTERTREIGIRKAIGAQRGAILGQFLVEATVLSLVGGLLGVAAGVAGSRFTVVGVRPVIVPSSIALALGVSVALGLFFGSYPAGRAARMRPIEALRHD